MSVELFINIIVILLLIPTIIFALILNKRLEILRNSRADLGRLIEAFNDATTRAEAGIPRLKQAADSAGAQLKDQMQKAQTLRDDIAFMLERAESVMGHLDNTVRTSAIREPVKETPMDKKRDQGRPTVKSEPRLRKRALVESPEDLISSAVSAAEDILRDVDSVGEKPRLKPFVPMGAEEVGDRSEAERELLKALQSMR